MKIAVWGANGRVGKSVVSLATQQGHKVFAVDTNNCNEFAKKVDVVIDFSNKKATKSLVNYCKKFGVPLVTGTTGLDKTQQKLIDKLKETVAVVQNSNFSKGIDAMTNALPLLINKLNNWDVEIVEIHHKHKLDSPSGTAKQLAQLVGVEVNNVHSLRQGTVFGTHTVVFAGMGESLTVTHNAYGVEIFAQGALDVATQLAKKV